jgi:kinetochore protein NDC80
MIPRCAGGASSGSGLVDNNDRENNGRASGIAAPSPSRHPSGGGSRLPPTTTSSFAASSRKSLGGLQYNSHTHTTSSSSTPAKNRRVSLAPTNSNTIPGSSSNIDPRDIKDKSYLQNAIRKMVSYLTTCGYRDASSLSVKQLVNNGPSGRDFQNIMTFLFRRMDPTFFVPPTPGNQRSDEIVPKFEDEVSMAFRFLGYPFPISKTGLVAVGSPHTWPALIAAIDWLVDLLLLRDEEEQFDWEPDENESSSDDWLTFNGNADRIKKQYHKFLRKSMVAFLNDNSEECEELEGNLLDTFLRDCERVERYVTGLDEECGKMREDIAVLNEEANW